MEKRIRRPRRTLSARFAETTTTPGKYYDGDGLILRVNQSGSKQWVQRIMINGKRTEIGMGSPPVISLADAREMAVANRRAMMMGRDPLAEKRERQTKAKAKPITFAECVAKYAEVRLDELRTEKYRQQWLSSVERLSFPVLGNLPVHEIGTKDVLKMLEPHWRKRTVTAKKLLGRVEAVLSWAKVAGYREGDNPAVWRGNLKELLPAPGKIARTTHQPALALTDVPAWWAELADRNGMATEALRFAMMTAARSGEVRGATWDEIHTDDAGTMTWIIPATRMKARREHRVPLADEATAQLKNLPRMEGTSTIFYAVRGGPLSDMSISAVMRRMQAAEELAVGSVHRSDQQASRRAPRPALDIQTMDG